MCANTHANAHANPYERVSNASGKSRQDSLKESVIPFMRFFIVHHESVIKSVRIPATPIPFLYPKSPGGTCIIPGRLVAVCVKYISLHRQIE